MLIDTVCTSGFVDEVMPSYNGGNSPNKDDVYVSTSSPGGGTEDEVRRLRRHLVLRLNKTL